MSLPSTPVREAEEANLEEVESEDGLSALKREKRNVKTRFTNAKRRLLTVLSHSGKVLDRESIVALSAALEEAWDKVNNVITDLADAATKSKQPALAATFEKELDDLLTKYETAQQKAVDALFVLSSRRISQATTPGRTWSPVAVRGQEEEEAIRNIRGQLETSLQVRDLERVSSPSQEEVPALQDQGVSGTEQSTSTSATTAPPQASARPAGTLANFVYKQAKQVQQIWIKLGNRRIKIAGTDCGFHLVQSLTSLYVIVLKSLAGQKLTFLGFRFLSYTSKPRSSNCTAGQTVLIFSNKLL